MKERETSISNKQKCLKISKGRRQTSWLFAQCSQRVKLRATKNKSSWHHQITNSVPQPHGCATFLIVASYSLLPLGSGNRTRTEPKPEPVQLVHCHQETSPTHILDRCHCWSAYMNIDSLPLNATGKLMMASFFSHAPTHTVYHTHL